jgi:hypothetical protein
MAKFGATQYAYVTICFLQALRDLKLCEHITYHRAEFDVHNYAHRISR